MSFGTASPSNVRCLQDLRQPWKLVTLGAGLSLLVAGSYYYEFQDWDVGISLLMGVLAYLFAPWSVRMLIRREWRKLLILSALCWPASSTPRPCSAAWSP